MAAIPDDGNVDLDVLVDRRWIDVDMDFLRSGREGIDPAGDAVIETRADANHQIAVVHRQIGFQGAMHPEHPEPLRVGGGVRTKTHQGRSNGKAAELDQLAQELARPRTGADHAAASVEERTLGALHQLDCALDALEIALELRSIPLVLKLPWLGIQPLG